MNALSETQRNRYREIIENLDVARQSVKELGDGYAFRFKAESQLILEAAEFIVYERLCCPFFDFELAMSKTAIVCGCGFAVMKESKNLFARNLRFLKIN